MDRKDKMDCITQMLKEGVENVFSSENYKNWLRVCSKFHRYSLNNQILILMQSGGTASQVAGYRKWQTLGRQVRKGEKGIWIISPMPITQKAESPDDEDKTLTLFKAATVFDISQTDGEDLPSLVQELTDDDASYDAIIDRLVDFSSVPVTFTDDLPNGVYGCFSPSEQCIKVRDTISRSHRTKMLIHEICHSIWEKDPKVMTDRQSAEVRAESCAYCVCNALGIDTSQYSFGYITSYSSGKELSELKAVMQDIRDTADKILSAIAPQEVTAVAT